MNRRDFLGLVGRVGAAVGLTWIGARSAAAGLFKPGGHADPTAPSTVWQIDPDLCIGCAICELKCPTEPDKGVIVLKVRDA